MRAGLSLGWTISLEREEAFRIVGRLNYLSPEREIMVDLLEPTSGNEFTLSGYAYKKDGELGYTRGRVRVPVNDSRIPEAVLAEAHRIRHLAGEFALAVRG